MSALSGRAPAPSTLAAIVAKPPERLTAQEGAAETPLHGAAWAGDLGAAKALVAAGADVNHIDSAGETPIHGAAAWGHADMVEYLISAGARVDLPGTTGLTPLHWAAGWGNLATVRVLAEAGADLEARNDFGRTAAEVAAEHRRSDVAAYLQASQRPLSPQVVIRSETDADASAISEVTVAAFKTLEISNHTEQFIVAALRAAGALAVSLVAEANGRVIGHIAFSPVAVSDGTPNWYGLGPVSVSPEYQRQGIGKALVQEGLSRLKNINARGCCLVGHPDYYARFGFRNMPGLVLEGVPPAFFFALSFDGHAPRGSVAFHDAFKAIG